MEPRQVGDQDRARGTANNLGGKIKEGVGKDEADRGPARERYKFYRDRGYPLQAHQLGE